MGCARETFVGAKLFLPKLCGCMPIVKFLQKSLWVPGPPGPGLPHPMNTVHTGRCEI